MIQDPSGRGPSGLQLTVAGIGSALVLLSLLFLLGLRYTGAFEEQTEVTALLTSTGDGLPANADVRYRGLIVGSVSKVDIVDKGELQHVDIEVDPHFAESIPNSVTARVVPANIFGVTAVELVDNPAGGPALTDGSTITEDHSEATVLLQSTLTTLRNVLNRVQPERLGRVLATLADALDPAARVPGSTIERLDVWLTSVDASIPDLGELLGDFGAATAGLNESAPELVDVLASSVQSSETIVSRRDRLVEMLASAGGTVDTVNTLFARNPDSGKELVVGLDQVFGSLAADPDALPYTAANLNSALNKLGATFSWGPSKQMVWVMDVSFTPFKQYTAADCPHYGDLYGPRCGGPTVPTVAPPQQYPPQMLPQRLAAAGPAPVIAPIAPPAAPLLPGLPPLPALPALPGLPKFELPGIVRPAAALRGPAAVGAIVGARPTVSQLLLLEPALAGGSLTVVEGSA
ncbi:MlaD family protein [Aldersonia kunmingensis]|uniref:MlaD family protein n=1 Tax=Aldersonia kunmingensis TaxID=408066 RepID=UPI00082EAD9B|nr:MCE family protein [Aldersonia kunmingensis]